MQFLKRIGARTPQLLFNLPSYCQRTEGIFKSLKKLDERSGSTEMLDSISLSSTELGWVAAS